MRWAGHAAHMGGMRSAHTCLVKKNLGKSLTKWENNIKIDLK